MNSPHQAGGRVDLPPPNADTSAPRYRMPAGACDTHCHVYGPTALYPLAERRAFNVDDAPPERLDAVHRTLGVQRAVIVQASVHGFDNRAMLAAIAGRGQTHRGVAIVEPTIRDDELRAMHHAGVRGLRYHFVRRLGSAPDLDEVLRMAGRIRPLGWHLVLHFDPQDLAGARPFLDRLPVDFVIDHMGRVLAQHGIGQEPFRVLLDILAGNERAWIKVSGSERVSALLSAAPAMPFADAAPFARALVEAAPDRCLWGSDWPHPAVREMPDDDVLVDLIPLFAPSEEQRARLLVDNPTRLYWND